MVRIGWLAAVEKILNAESHDLRALARLADLDPRTMFIGTRMDGADLRGQDLRGMIFTHLDRSKVRSDETTRLDGDQDVPELQQEGPHALVYFFDDHLWELYETGRGVLPFPVRIYARQEAQNFNRDRGIFSIPALVVGLLDRSLEPQTAELLEGLDGEVLAIVGRRGQSASLSSAERDWIDAMTLPVILTSLGGDPGPHRRQTRFDPHLNDLMRLVIEDWSNLWPAASEQRLSFFLRARMESGSSAPDSAWFQLYGRAYHLGLARAPGICLDVVASDEPRLLPLANGVLFPQMTAISIAARIGRSLFDTALLIDIHSESQSEIGPAYDEVVLHLLRQRGWTMAREVDQDRDRLTLEGQLGDIQALLNTQMDSAAFRPRPEHPDELSFGEVDQICISEAADPSLIVTMLAARRTLWVNLQDLRTFFAEDGTLWSLIARQARRMARSGGRHERTLYFGGILNHAIEQSRVDTAEGHALRRELQAPDFLRKRRSELTIIKAAGDRFECEVDLVETPRTDAPPVLRFRLTIDAQGPSILPPDRPWRMRRSTAGRATPQRPAQASDMEQPDLWGAGLTSDEVVAAAIKAAQSAPGVDYLVIARLRPGEAQTDVLVSTANLAPTLDVEVMARRIVNDARRQLIERSFDEDWVSRAEIYLRPARDIRTDVDHLIDQRGPNDRSEIEVDAMAWSILRAQIGLSPDPDDVELVYRGVRIICGST